VSPYPTSQVEADGPTATTCLELVHDELEAVEARLRLAAASSVRQVDAVGRHLLLAGGKRFRPACVILSAKAVSRTFDYERLVAVAAAMELVHTATLVHDDVVDNTWVRRGAATANAVFGNGVAVLTGDYLLARAVDMLVHEENTRLARTLARITVDMSEGEVLQMVATGDPHVEDSAYYDMIRKKTAVFISGCCRAGAILGDASEDEELVLADYGLNLGMAFQIADDLLDYTGDPAVTGKPVGTDLREGRATLPLLLGLRTSGDGQRETLLAAFGNGSLQDKAVSVVVRTLARLGAFDEADAIARRFATEAKMTLASLRPTSYRDALAQLADYAVDRNR